MQFANVESAIKCFNAMNGRYYAARPLTPEFVPVTRWRIGICVDIWF